ncbi:Methyltransferase domain-containing protein [Polaribacter sp. Hel1_33_78]|uniref:class I SAM-dependent DNA methyltransferase n=1 Tax=Polaribacter sp. Hel1_33_78 TaxID=1336804 RepID=UPI00087A571F|nr:DNA methyltransferase [Polaribacter sp. Hel1_33_78]SDU11538.1 Methyltransferase domain-containing protein [Polaribacter sp. Hel1_33_78]
MKSTEIKTNVQNLIDNFSKEEFIYNLLIAYGISKTSVTRLKKGDYNFAKADGEILYKKKIFFKVEASDKLLSSIEEIAKEEQIAKHKPRFAIVTDYKQIVAKDLKLGNNLDIELKDLPNYFDFFLPLAGSEVYNATNDNEADRNASYKMASLYDLLIEENPQIYNSKASIHNLNIFLSRLLFCFFAEDTEIFKEDSIFTNTLAQHTDENGKDTHSFLDELFERLNTENAEKFPEYLRKFEYVNGGLFKDPIKSPTFTAKARKTLIDLGELQWKDINPDIFGSMIQAVVIPDYRSDLGMHYTSVENILKLIKPLFLDELYEEFEKAKTVNQLRTLIKRLSKIKFFDPACGSGNFLIITYKEIRLLEIRILEKIIDLSPNPTLEFTQIQLSQFYGIEIDDFAHEMAILSLWLAEHQMNRVFEDTLFDFGRSNPILPLKEAGQITHGNATREDWKKACPISKSDEVYIIGNPPYLGFKGWDSQQKKDMALVFSEFTTVNRLDFISCWFKKGTDYIKDNNAKLAFVSTNSICQGEQVSLIWPYILNNVEINFAYTSFSWSNSAKGNAGVSVIIISLANKNKQEKIIFSDNRKISVKNINPYLTGGDTIYIKKRNEAISILPKMVLGSSGIDGGNLILSKEEKDSFISQNPNSKEFIKKFLGGNDFLNGVERYCIWIDDDKIEKALKNNLIKDRVDKCEIYRLNGGRDARKASDVPHRFFYRKYEEKESLILPFTSSERRIYLPVDLGKKETVFSNGMLVIYNFQPYYFAILVSKMHMIWAKAVGGKLETRLRYSVSMVYNTFPFPNISDKQKENLNLYVFAILDERAKHPSKTMAQLYNPDTMPKGLLKAHQELDTAIEQCYRLQPFKNDTERLEYLFKQYEEMSKKDTLFAKQKKTRKKKAKK